MKLIRLLIVSLIFFPLVDFAGNFSLGYDGFFENFDGVSMDHKMESFYKFDMGLYLGPEIKYYAHENSFAYAAMVGYTHAIGDTKVTPYIEMGYSWGDSVQALRANKDAEFEYDVGIGIPLVWGLKLQYEIDQAFDHAKMAQYSKLHYPINQHVDVSLGAAWGQANSFGHYTTPIFGLVYIF